MVKLFFDMALLSSPFQRFESSAPPAALFEFWLGSKECMDFRPDYLAFDEDEAAD